MNQSVTALIARDEHFVGGRDAGPGPLHTQVVRIPAEGHRLVEELRRIARAPYLAMPWPEPPNVDLSRLVADFERTTAGGWRPCIERFGRAAHGFRYGCGGV